MALTLVRLIWPHGHSINLGAGTVFLSEGKGDIQLHNNGPMTFF
jgi:hypothetical protein